MSYERLPYADAETPHTMSTDAHEAGSHLHLSEHRPVEDAGGDLFDQIVAAGPSVTSRVAVPDSLARLAGEMELHFD
jgi:hypothetical protein